MRPEYCRIERWRGYFSSSFVVRLPDQTIVESRAFRWRHEAPPQDDGAARAAYDELVDRLEASGWTHHADGPNWFATTFARLVESYETELPSGADPQTAAPPPEPTPIVVRELRPPARDAEPEQAARPPDRRPARRHSWVASAVGGACLAAAVASVFVLVERRNERAPVGDVATRTVALRAQPDVPDIATKGVQGSSHSVRAKPLLLVDLRVTAHGNGSWLEIRRGSATGTLLYSATLTDGETLHFHAPKLWARFGAASNLTVVADGRTLPLQGTYEKLFAPPR